MDKKNLMIEIGYKIRKVREVLKLTNSQLADHIGHARSSFCRYEQGKTPPRLTTLYRLGEKYNVSLDWLIRDKGEMFYKKKEVSEPKKETIETPGPPPRPTLDSLPGDIRELLEHMERREEKGWRPGGFGLLMVRANVDELIYNEAQNEVVFIKYLD